MVRFHSACEYRLHLVVESLRVERLLNVTVHEHAAHRIEGVKLRRQEDHRNGRRPPTNRRALDRGAQIVAGRRRQRRVDEYEGWPQRRDLVERHRRVVAYDESDVGTVEGDLEAGSHRRAVVDGEYRQHAALIPPARAERQANRAPKGSPKRTPLRWSRGRLYCVFLIAAVMAAAAASTRGTTFA